MNEKQRLAAVEFFFRLVRQGQCRVCACGHVSACAYVWRHRRGGGLWPCRFGSKNLEQEMSFTTGIAFLCMVAAIMLFFGYRWTHKHN